MLPGKIYDTVSIERRARRSEGTEANSFNDVFGAWLCARIVPRACSTNSVCRPALSEDGGLPQVTGPLPSLRRTRRLIPCPSKVCWCRDSEVRYINQLS